MPRKITWRHPRRGAKKIGNARIVRDTSWDLKPAKLSRVVYVKQVDAGGVPMFGAPFIPLRKKRLRDSSELENAFALILYRNGLIGWQREYKFCANRRFRADFADVTNRVLVEIEGGAFSGGRHVRGAGFVKDCEKYNIATALGWRVLRYATKKQMRTFISQYRALCANNNHGSQKR